MAISRQLQVEIETLLRAPNGEVYILADGIMMESYALLEGIAREEIAEIVTFKNGSRTGRRSQISSLIDELHGRLNVNIITREEASKILDTPTWRTKW